MTPVFIEWAAANMPQEVFKRRYTGRIPATKLAALLATAATPPAEAPPAEEPPVDNNF